MTQNSIVFIIILATIGYSIFAIVRNLKKKSKSPCDGCDGCDLKHTTKNGNAGQPFDNCCDKK